ncbi:hypothetical protein EDD52_12248 [Primorskyibacter sedentarius]|uniref:Uncharacterized protein n=1 Tax=Primorskyibacter sedentarius TaxID=745311 RepID=A0A4R3J3Y2_9RHOB|nr:hypothetical protein [Primorskyibacter sedentarius]TCS59089.1 hypothetical protein EDD52_12248 [Primorskyibacter sedentarius]
MNIYLDIAIALISLFLILSLFVTALTEAVATLFKTRAKHLSHALKTLLNDDEFRLSFYKHPLISSNDALKGDRIAERWKHPSYVPSVAFAKALFQAIVEAQGETAPLPHNAADMRTSVAQIANPALRKKLLALVDQSHETLDDVRMEFANWFDTAMGYLSGGFKRQQQAISFVIAFGVAAIFNLDVIGLSADLAKDDALRQAMVAQAVETAASDGPMEFTELDKALDALNIFALGHDTKQGFCTVLANVSLTQIFGWLVAAFAATLGAPFWFDLLKRFVNIRGAGTRPQDNGSAISNENTSKGDSQ